MRRYLAQVFASRDLLWWLTVKELEVRYKSPLLGCLWAFVVPLTLSALLWMVFTFLLPRPTDRGTFFLFLVTGLVPWSFFANALGHGVMCLLDAGPLIKKAAFPRAVIPMAVVLAHGFNFVCALVVVVALVACLHGLSIRWIWLLPVVVFLHGLLTMGAVLLVSALQVRYRDMKYLVELALVCWFYGTPIFYPVEAVRHAPAWLSVCYGLNPFAYVLELYRVALIGSDGGFWVTPWQALAVVCAAAGIAVAGGIAVFRRYEPTAADWVLG